MPIKGLPYISLELLLSDNLSSEEDKITRHLIGKLRPVKKRGWMTKEELIEVCFWKSPRAIWHIRSNRADVIRRITETAFGSRSEQVRIEELTKLSGVSLPMASAILMLTDPKRYGVIDIRIWEILYELGTMKDNPKGRSFTFQQWFRYLMILRHFSKKFEVSCRDVERTIFIVHQQYQDGVLYRNLSKK